jgi:hypothetical protein
MYIMTTISHTAFTIENQIKLLIKLGSIKLISHTFTKKFSFIYFVGLGCEKSSIFAYLNLSLL